MTPPRRLASRPCWPASSWSQCAGTLAALVYDRHKDRLVEVGPGGQIRAMVKRVDGGAWKAMECVGV